jgi:acyl carrier protein
VSWTREEIQARATKTIAEALEKDVAEVRPSSSLVDDLGAESIDFLDILFRIESDFGIKIAGDEIWKGELDLANAEPAEFERGLKILRERMPDFPWERFQEGVSKKDLRRLITVQTIVDYLDRTLRKEEESTA